MNRLKTNTLRILILIFPVATAIHSHTLLAVEYAQHYRFPNGVTVRLYSPEAILEHLIDRDQEGRLVLKLASGMTYILVEDVSDPVITNKGDGSFHPMNVDWILQAIDAVDIGGQRMDVDAELYVLPYPRYHFMASSAAGSVVFLSPGVYEVDRRVVAYTVTHELGHVFGHRYMSDGDGDDWYRYLTIRNIYGDPRYTPVSSHSNRPDEIFAEDFRYLFGGKDSRYSGTIENSSLALPDQVAGLEEFMISLVTADVASSPTVVPVAMREILSISNYPNPFNPSTTIRAEFSTVTEGQAGEVAIDVYGVDGSLVRRVYSGHVTGTVLEVSWDGRNEGGAPASSGVYFFVVRTARDTASGKMFLVR